MGSSPRGVGTGSSLHPVAPSHLDSSRIREVLGTYATVYCIYATVYTQFTTPNR